MSVAPQYTPAVCLLGPTGTGKTELALRLAAEFAFDIVSVDSAMVYRQMDVGTAKPSIESRRAVVHHLIDIRDPWETFSAGEFRSAALRAMECVRARGRVPLLVGGTMLYFRSLWRGLAPLPPAQPALRAALDAEAAKRGWGALHDELARVDPVAASRIKDTDRQRIQRALEVFRSTGQPLSVMQRQAADGTRVSGLVIGLVPSDRSALRRRLDARLADMLAAGFVDEVRRLRELPLMSAGSPSMRAVGYRQFWQYLAGELPRAEAERQAAVATHRLAKRQLTWMRSEALGLAVDPASADAYRVISRAVAGAGVSRDGQG